MQALVGELINFSLAVIHDVFLYYHEKPVLVREREARYMLKRFVCFIFIDFGNFWMAHYNEKTCWYMSLRGAASCCL